MIDSLRRPLTGLLLLSLAGLVNLSCEQYDYTSPYPGILEVRLKAANSRAGSLLPFDPGNSFVMTLRSLEVVERPPVSLPIYSDLNAIRRNPDGDFFNCLHPLARDSAFILGRVYSPPVTYTQLLFTAQVSPFVLVRNPFTGFANLIEVRQDLLTEALQSLPAPGQVPFAIRVETDRRTVVTVTFDLDSSLVRRTEWFQYRPYFYVSSIEIF
jgi:hypothetical protein